MGTASLYRNYLWLVDTIYSAGHITREELDRKWSNCSLNEDHASRIPERTFHRWRIAIEEIFGIDIKCNKSQGNIYYIENKEKLEHSATFHWLLNTFSVAQLVRENRDLQDYILLEEMPSDTKYLAPLLNAIRAKQVVRLTYLVFNSSEAELLLFAPYCVKAFRRRWYVTGINIIGPNDIKTLSLDRIKDLEISGESYTIPSDFNAHEYFENYFGILRNEHTTEPQRMVLEVIPEEADYLRSLPLHHSQHEIETKDGFVYFEYYIVPTFDLFQELLLHGQAIRVIEPEIFAYWLKKEAQWIVDLYPDIKEK